MKTYKRVAAPVRRGILVGVAGVLTLAVVTALAATVFTPVPVKVKPNPIYEQSPAASATYFAWTQNSKAHHATSYMYVQKVSGGSAVRVNPVGSQVYGGGISGSQLVYQQVVKGQSNIRYFNLVKHTHANPPSGVNSTQWEFAPTNSGKWLLFGRTGKGTQRVLLMNVNTRSIRVLMNRATANNSGATPGQVNGNWATFDACTKKICTVYRENISANTLTTIPLPAGKTDYATSVASNGTLYFVESGLQTCGNMVRMRRAAVGGSPTTIYSFKQGNDVETTQLANGSPDTLYYTRVVCSNFGDNIYKSAVN